jgi:exopolysaccharide biosynthesis polyprenyl glycosylphosphotransferase
LKSEVIEDRGSARTPSRKASVATAFQLVPRVRSRERDPAIPEGRRTLSSQARDALSRRLLATADVAAALSAILVAVAVLGNDDAVKPLLLFALPLIVVVNKAIGLYDRDEHLLNKTTLDEVPRLFNVATLISLILWFAEPALISGSLGRGQLVIVWLLLFGALMVLRGAARFVANRRSRDERCLVLGDRDSALRVSQKFEAIPGFKARVVGRVPLTSAATRASDTVGGIEDLGLVLAREEIERVVIAPCDADSEEDILNGIRLVKSLGVKVSVLPRLFEVVGSSVEFDELHGFMLLGVRPYGLTDSSWALKRMLDITLSALALVALAPLMCFMAAAVAVTSPGGVFFRQPRVGFHGRTFHIFKFRTMYADAEQRKEELSGQNEADGLFKIENDPRATPVGRFLRKTSLDELPQLLNVLRGDMSLVGPRPLVPDEDSRIEGFDRRRLHVMPGMTGAWQIFGSSRIPLHEMVKIDYMYGANWSLWGDVKILVRTVPYVLARRSM